MARPQRHGVELLQNISYTDSGEPHHLLDIYRPARRSSGLPVVLYVHGGGFRILSKDTHWLMGLMFARRGYLVFNINYRLAPAHPYPAAVEDACQAYTWVARNARRYGGDLSQGWILAGESAGANLVTGLTVAACFEREEPWARAVFDTERVPNAVVAGCGMLQTSDADRFSRRRPLPQWVSDRLEEVTASYLGAEFVDRSSGEDFADPLCFLEQSRAAERPLPPFFAPVGTRDPLLDDTRRLERALARRGVRCETRFYPGEVHAFMAFIWRRQARRCWTDTFRFLGHDG
jgi:acetyl esterase